jgi:copper(I)-binding protein
MRNPITPSVLAFSLCAAAPAMAEVTAENSWMQPALRPGAAVAAYVTLRNSSDKPDSCRVVGSDITPSVHLHETVNVGDIMRMKAVERIDLPPKGTLTMTPGTMHIMFTGVAVPLKVEDVVNITFDCEESGVLEVPVKVVPFGSR